MATTYHRIEQKDQWEQLVALWPEANFLQAWNWGTFHQALGKTTWALAWGDEHNQVSAIALVVKEAAKRGTYLTIAGGPLLDWNNTQLMEQVFSDLKALGKEAGASFIRFRPQALDSVELRRQVAQAGAVEAPMHVTADVTVQLDLTKTEEEILAEMRKSTRYEIRRAEKMGIRVELSNNPDDIAVMYQQQLALAKKHGFVPFSQTFWLEQFKSFVGDNQVLLFHSFLEGNMLASAFILFYNHEAVYHYGTSTPENQKLPGSYAVQWAAIKEAKQRGCTRYNMWGVAPANQPKHRFAGVTTFKTGFCEHTVTYLPAHDLPVSASYQLVRAFELLRKKLRRL